MLDFDNFREIWSTIQKNKLRTFLTGFSVAWGIFMLIVLLGAGNGMRNGIMKNFDNWADNRVEMWGRRTTKPYRGLQNNRPITLKYADFEALKRDNPEVDLISATISHSDTLSYGEENNVYSLEAVHPAKGLIDKFDKRGSEGRFINDVDLIERRKVIVISVRMQEVLFKGKSPIGEFINVGPLRYKVIGVYKDEQNSNNSPAFIPFSTGQLLYGDNNTINNLLFTVKDINTEAESEAFEQRVRGQFGRRHQFDPEDNRALGIWNTLDDFRMMNGMMNGITLFIWIIGIGTLTAGIVGVSNIMLITVRERTKEFGIRKALGATPFSILKLIIIESILITAVFGYMGMIGGVGLTEGINMIMESMNAGNEVDQNDMSIFYNPTVSLGVALSSTLLIICAGVVAGYFPARKAIKITAIEAMRTEN